MVVVTATVDVVTGPVEVKGRDTVGKTALLAAGTVVTGRGRVVTVRGTVVTVVWGEVAGTVIGMLDGGVVELELLEDEPVPIWDGTPLALAPGVARTSPTTAAAVVMKIAIVAVGPKRRLIRPVWLTRSRVQGEGRSARLPGTAGWGCRGRGAGPGWPR
jgi:hypothetical protein